ncbi:hypothetical protein [Roseovarius sp. 2305UL8-3]|uniref:hypothetical protein n=1 Tax=Roseovarius conchicola TaxID=3121636 RepID=UPI003527022C
MTDVMLSAFAPTDTLVDHCTLVGAGVSYDVINQAEVFLQIANLFDEDYEKAGGFHHPPAHRLSGPSCEVLIA